LAIVVSLHKNMQIASVNSLNLPLAHYIGRGGKGQKQSALANPYPVSMGREECVKAFRRYAYEIFKGAEPTHAIAVVGLPTVGNIRIPTRQEFMAELNSFKPDSILVCFCYKQPTPWAGEYKFQCHGEVVASLWQYIQKQSQF
jgi:hypothetical protein